MINDLESVVEHIDEILDSQSNSRILQQDCSWLDEILDDLIKIGNDTSAKSNIAEMAELITSVNVNLCTKKELENLKDDKDILNDIICELKGQIGESCVSDTSRSTDDAATHNEMLSTEEATRVTTYFSTTFPITTLTLEMISKTLKIISSTKLTSTTENDSIQSKTKMSLSGNQYTTIFVEETTTSMEVTSQIPIIITLIP